jgi:hypothetical protein
MSISNIEEHPKYKSKDDPGASELEKFVSEITKDLLDKIFNPRANQILVNSPVGPEEFITILLTTIFTNIIYKVADFEKMTAFERIPMIGDHTVKISQAMLQGWMTIEAARADEGIIN